MNRRVQDPLLVLTPVGRTLEKLKRDVERETQRLGVCSILTRTARAQLKTTQSVPDPLLDDLRALTIGMLGPASGG
jgi:hypothetical protein